MNEPKAQPEDPLPQTLDWENWEFDPDYFVEAEAGRNLDGGGMVIFRLTHKTDDKHQYLHLFNCHNGYYGHGFTMTIGGDIKHEGSL